MFGQRFNPAGFQQNLPHNEGIQPGAGLGALGKMASGGNLGIQKLRKLAEDGQLGVQQFGQGAGAGLRGLGQGAGAGLSSLGQGLGYGAGNALSSVGGGLGQLLGGLGKGGGLQGLMKFINPFEQINSATSAGGAPGLFSGPFGKLLRGPIGSFIGAKMIKKNL